MSILVYVLVFVGVYSTLRYYNTKNGVCLLARWMFKVGKKRYDGTRGILPAIERKDHRTSSMFYSLSLLASCALYGGN
jgi:hypothetical protein